MQFHLNLFFKIFCNLCKCTYISALHRILSLMYTLLLIESEKQLKVISMNHNYVNIEQKG